MSVITCQAPCNIAVIKYWGKRDELLSLPLNGSICGTLEHLWAKTTVMISPNFKKDRIWLNGREESIENEKIQKCLHAIKKRSQLPEEQKNWKIHISSVNNFPTAAGLASSAAGYACLAVTLSKLYKVEGDISKVARLGSGSACRSVHGGFVRWYLGSEPDGSDSISKPIAPASYWPEMRVLVLVCADKQKHVLSTPGMRAGVETSVFLRVRAERVVPPRLDEMHKAILDRDMALFAELAMKDSNNMHAACLDTYPPCIYMDDISNAVVYFVHAYNAIGGVNKVGYTYDAGPNPTLYLLEKDVPEFTALLNHYFPRKQDADVEYIKGMPVEPFEISEDTFAKMNFKVQSPGLLKYLFHTRISDGPREFKDSSSHLLDSQGLPVNCTPN